MSPTRSSAFRETPRGGTSTSRGPAAVCLSALPRTAISRSVPSGFATDRVRWMPCELDIAGITTIDDLLDAVDDRMDDLARECEGRQVIARVTIAGRGPLHRDLDPAGNSIRRSKSRSARGRPTPEFLHLDRAAGLEHPA